MEGLSALPSGGQCLRPDGRFACNYVVTVDDKILPSSVESAIADSILPARSSSDSPQSSLAPQDCDSKGCWMEQDLLLEMYVEGSEEQIVDPIEVDHDWVARLSAAGYLKLYMC